MEQKLGMDPQTILSELDAAVTRLESQPIIDAKKELGSNVYPLLRLTVETLTLRDQNIRQRVALAENVIAEYLSAQESMILPELAEHIVTAFGVGAKVCEEVEKIADLPKVVTKLIEAYRKISASAVQQVADVTLEEVDEDEEEAPPRANGHDEETTNG